jgi:hypothetical protein|tara:strand:+ start:268 stop:621 length:354 start_codon:yes stop_codon:yes gene_type:complete
MKRGRNNMTKTIIKSAEKKTLKDAEENATVLAFMWIPFGGSTWYQGRDETKSAVECVKLCKQDWGHLYKFKKHSNFKVCIYDISKVTEGWTAEISHKIYELKTKKEVPFVKTVTVVL